MSRSTAKLGDIAEFIRGITFKPDDVVPVDTDDAVICMRTKNVQTLLDCDDLLAVPSEFVRRKDQYLQEGDVLVSSANSWNLVGKCCWIPTLPWKAAFGGFISVLRGNPNYVDKRYLYWWFASDRTQALLRSFGQKTTNISNLNIERALQLELPLPPLQQQRRIAAILDKADTLRAKRREALAQLDRLAQSIFVEMFGDPGVNPKGWPQRTLKELGKVSTGRTPPSALDDMFGGEIPFITPGDLESDKPVKRTVTLTGAQEAGTVRAGAALVCCIGTVGKMGMAMVRSSFNQQLNAVEWHSMYIHDQYGMAVLRFFKPTIVSWASSTTIPILKKSIFEKIAIPVPPIALQQEFAKRIQALHHLEKKMRSDLEASTELFLALQSRAFQGRL